jgi:hypothetical protein
LFSAALAALLLFAPASRADGLQLSIASGVTATAGSTGNTFDVLLTNTGASALNVDSFAFSIVVADSDISFTDATTSTSDPYIYAGDSFVVINGFPLPVNSLPGQTLVASDLSNSGAGQVIGSGATFALGSIVFDVASGATPGVFAVNFDDGPITSFADPNANLLDFASISGTITVTPSTSPMPEPATSGLLLCALAGLFLLHRRGAVAE